MNFSRIGTMFGSTHLFLTRRDFLVATAATSLLGAQSNSEQPPVATPRRIRIGQIGLSHPHSLGKLQAIRMLPDLYEVVGVCEPDSQKRKLIEGLPFMDSKELLATPGLQAVAIETAVSELISSAELALDSGMHIHLDKPAGVDYKSFARIAEIARSHNLIIQMGYMLRYNPAFQFMYQAVQDGWFGDILEINASMGKKADDSLRQELSQYPGGGFFELACHLLDSVIYMLGEPMESKGYHIRSGLSQGDSFADNQLAVLHYPQCLVTLRCNHRDPFGSQNRRFQIIGTQGGMEIHPLESGQFKLFLDRPRGQWSQGIHSVTLPDGGRSYVPEFQDLAHSIHTHSPLKWTLAHDLSVHRNLLSMCDMLNETPDI